MEEKKNNTAEWMAASAEELVGVMRMETSSGFGQPVKRIARHMTKHQQKESIFTDEM